MKKKLLALERCQTAAEINEYSMVHGEAGFGVYAYVPNSAMRAYYSARGEQVFRIKQLQGDVIDLSRGILQSELIAFAKNEFIETSKIMAGYQIPKVNRENIQRFGGTIERFMVAKYPNAVAYLVPHKGPGIPNGIQAVIKNMLAFEVTNDNAPTLPQSVEPTAERKLSISNRN